MPEVYIIHNKSLTILGSKIFIFVSTVVPPFANIAAYLASDSEFIVIEHS